MSAISFLERQGLTNKQTEDLREYQTNYFARDDMQAFCCGICSKHIKSKNGVLKENVKYPRSYCPDCNTVLFWV